MSPAPRVFDTGPTVNKWTTAFAAMFTLATLLATPAADVAKAEASFFPDVDLGALAKTIATYQKLGNWTPHVEITRPAWEATVDIFLHAGLIKKRHRYEDVIAPPPG